MLCCFAFAGIWRFVRCRKGICSTECVGVYLCGSILDGGLTRIRCPHLLKFLPGPGSKPRRPRRKAGADERYRETGQPDE